MSDLSLRVSGMDMDLRASLATAEFLDLPSKRGRIRRRQVEQAYLAAVDHALILIEPDGHVARCSSQAQRLLGVGADVVGRPLRALLSATARGRAQDRSIVLMQLRGPLRRAEACTLEWSVNGVSLAIDIRPLSNSGWSVTVETARARADRRQKGLDGASDPLTGLPNRSQFQARLGEARARLDRTGEAFAVLAIDLDRFKHVNDTLGHPVGDALLRKVAERLKTALRPTDAVSRFGGDEFAVVQANVSDAIGAETLARRLVDLLGRAYVVDGHLINIGASVGLTLAPTDGVDPDVLLKNADLALYRAKSDGRDTFRFFEPEMDARMQARRALELDLRKALALQEFVLVYQPQMNLETNQIVGCEALIRWHHPTRGMVSPAEFIPLAEEIGLIVPIGEWVLRTACSEAARWPDGLTVAVNLSPAQFKSKKLVQTVASALRASGLAANRLELEITEGVLLQENAANLATLHALRELGLRISMDDFGTGYSSLSYLRSFPFDKIKIDRSFVSGSTSVADSMAIVGAIASLGSSFGMTTVAEGVETPEQMHRIRAEGCTDVQGYLISRPIPAAEILKMFADQTSGAAV
ncbi:putative bifunctional diguanylate cyclase/phosphodiesterase [Lichenibacterium dinghuense]|uniref:putative bifunctional diguanylate cyclase/phosphodiesterase n=1 Tax=Lichenibacterium dinghuense TaxID=2895977 RepID=UPI001F33BE75|nr:EAL domain-containing protein [Lichenibacterium sp. 6Y81]